MNNLLQSSWYVLYTKPKWEKKVAELLGKKNYEYYCPLNKVVKQWHDRRKTIMEPLFSSYVFVKATVQQLTFVRDMPGVVSFVYWLGKPAVVRAEEIQAIKDFLGEHSNVQLEKIDVNLHDKVKIVRGPLIHKEGTIVQINSNSVKIELPSMGYALVAKVSKAHIQLSDKVPEILLPFNDNTSLTDIATQNN